MPGAPVTWARAAGNSFVQIERAALKPLPVEPTSSPNGAAGRSGRSSRRDRPASSPWCPTPSRRRRSGCVSPHGPSRYSMKNSALPLTPTRRATAGTHGAGPYAAQSPGLCRLDAGAADTLGDQIGPDSATLVEVILKERKHPVQGFRTCLASCAWRKGGLLPSSRRRPATPSRSTPIPTAPFQSDPERQAISPDTGGARGRPGDHPPTFRRRQLLPLRKELHARPPHP